MIPLHITGGGKSRYVPVSELTPEQLKARRAGELRAKQAQRAKKKGQTVGEYRENIVANVTKVRERKETKVWDRELRRNERQIFRDDLKRAMDKTGGPGVEVIPGIGRNTIANRRKLKNELKKVIREWVPREGDNWDAAIGDLAKVAGVNL